MYLIKKLLFLLFLLILIGGCKHASVFLMCINCRTENPSPTEVKCYWAAPRLGRVGTTKKFITITELSIKSNPSKVQLPDNSQFLPKIMKIAEEKQLVSQLTRYHFDLKERQLYKLSLHQILKDFLEENDTTADNFILFASSKITEILFKKAVEKTRLQSDDLIWFELRY